MRIFTTLSAGLLAAVLLAPAGSAQGAATQSTAPVAKADAEETGHLTFAIDRDGNQIGTHRIAFRRSGDRLTVKVAIDIEVGLGPIPLYTYTHRNTTTWRNGHLMAMDTTTDDNGEEFFVKARRTDDGRLAVETRDGRRTVAGDLLPSTYWMTATAEASRLLNTQKGGVDAVTIAPKGRKPVALPGGGEVEAQGYDMDGGIDADIWYAPDGRLVGLKFTARGATVRYDLIELSGVVPTQPPQSAAAGRGADSG